jgi:hypothetical protein
MFTGVIPRSLLVVAFLLAGLASSPAQILYDGTLGLPAVQGWTFFVTGGTQTSTGTGVQLDTTAANSFQGGYSLTTSTLNRTNGFAVRFTSRMIAEAHASNNRGGFAVIVLADDHRGIELAFWTNTIFAQSDSPLFIQAEATSFSATATVDYTLTFRPTNYVLLANGVPILSGFVRDYSAFAGFPNPYSSQNFLFFGDDTTSAAGNFFLNKVVLVAAPQLVSHSNKIFTWTGVSNQTYTVQSSSNLTSWATASSVTSVTTNFAFTNSSTASSRFFRVSYP